MPEYIKVAATFDGDVSFVSYGCLNNDKKTPYVEFLCIDEESGKGSYGKMFCSKDALPYTVKKLEKLGVEGDTEQAVILGASSLSSVPCTFETKDNDGYFNADNVRPRGEPAGGGSDGMDAADFLARVFGATVPATSTPPATQDGAKPASDNLPF